jgi:hypothetical protein
MNPPITTRNNVAASFNSGDTRLAQAGAGTPKPSTVKAVSGISLSTGQELQGELMFGRTNSGKPMFWLRGQNKDYELRGADGKPVTNALDAETRAIKLITGGGATQLRQTSEAPGSNVRTPDVQASPDKLRSPPADGQRSSETSAVNDKTMVSRLGSLKTAIRAFDDAGERHIRAKNGTTAKLNDALYNVTQFAASRGKAMSPATNRLVDPKNSDSLVSQATSRLARNIDQAEVPLDTYDAQYRRKEVLAYGSGAHTPRNESEKAAIESANQYVKERFSPPLRTEAGNLMGRILCRHFDATTRADAQNALKDMLSSPRGSEEGAMKMLRAINAERRTAKVAPLSAAGMTPLQALENNTAARMGRESLNGVVDLVMKLKNVEPTGPQTVKQAKFRGEAEAEIKKFASYTGQTDVKNIEISPRDPKNIIALTHQDSSAALFKSKNAFAVDVKYDSLSVLGHPVQSKFTVWYNDGGFVRAAGTPYRDQVKAKETDAATGKEKRPPGSTQITSRVGLFEMGIQGNVGLNANSESAKYANAGFSMIVRGPHAKTVTDMTNQGKLSIRPSFNMGFDVSGYATAGLFRAGPYFEFGRFLPKDKPFHVFDRFDIGVNPAIYKDIQDGKYNHLGNQLWNDVVMPMFNPGAPRMR